MLGDAGLRHPITKAVNELSERRRDLLYATLTPPLRCMQTGVWLRLLKKSALAESNIVQDFLRWQSLRFSRSAA